jgi:hypothetical protein
MNLKENFNQNNSIEIHDSYARFIPSLYHMVDLDCLFKMNCKS